MIGHAAKDENGNYKNGKVGDQTGKEVYIRSWYNRPWNVVLRCKDKVKANKIADAMEKACENSNIGYDQIQRNTLWKQAYNLGFDPSKVTVPCETDCSALVSLCCAYAGIATQYLQVSGNSLTTRTLRKQLLKSGEFEALTDSRYLISDKYLLRGDILLYEGHHTAVNLDDGSETHLKSIDEIAKEVIAGKYGSGDIRRANLTAMGYNYALVQARVNEMLKANTIKDIPKYMWDFLLKEFKNPYGVAGLMGNIKAESNLNPKNLQNSFEKKLGMDDDTYVSAVDSGAYGKFATDSAGFGICQWSGTNRKRNLYSYKEQKKASIGDLKMQLEFLIKEMKESYKKVYDGLKKATSVREASDLVLTKFERPKDQSESVKVKRASFGDAFFNAYN